MVPILSWANNELTDDLSYKKALDYFNTQKFNETIDVLNKTIKDNPNEDSYYILMGRAYENLKNNDKAKDSYEKAIELNTNDVRAYVGRSTVSSDFNEQEYWAKQAIEKFPYQSTAAVALLNGLYVSQAIQEESTDNTERAIKLLKEAKKINTDYLERLEMTPENIFQEEVSETAEKLDKQTLKEQIEKRVLGLEGLEDEWNQKYNK